LRHLFVFLTLSTIQFFSAFVSANTVSVNKGFYLDPNAKFHPVFANHGMVVSQEKIASKVGADILAAGGNAVDAAVATGFALAVTLPRAGNIGGGGFMLVYLADKKKTLAIDYREMAPAAAYKNMFLTVDGDVDSNKARYSVHSAGVPGTVAGLIYAQQKYGRLTLAETIKPAINLARHGFEVSPDLSDSLRSRYDRLRKQPSTKKYFYKADGGFYMPGDRFYQSDLGATLARIGAYGVDGFYKGTTAGLIVNQMQNTGGLITLEDLASYRVVEREPVCGKYRSISLCAMPPPSSGGVHLLQMLNMLENWELSKFPHNSAAHLHLMIEVMRQAYADRSLYLGDPDFVPVPTIELISKQYASKLSALIDSQNARSSAAILPSLHILDANLPVESPETTHFSVWDSEGNIVSNTYTLNLSYGSGIAVEGAGFLLNNEMDDFASKPGVPNAYGLIGGAANAIEGFKRPLSSMTPTIVFDSEGMPILATGSPGGSTIITIVLQMIINMVDYKMGVAEATAAPRIHHQWLPDRLFYETGISSDSLKLLESMGHNLQDKPRVLGATQSISWDGGRLQGASDPRRHGGAAAAY